MTTAKDHARERVVGTCAGLVLQVPQLSVMGTGKDNDALLYRHYAVQWTQGNLPYRDFHPEYPPGAMWLFVLPYRLGATDPDVYRWVFAAEMALFGLCIVWCLVFLTQRLWPTQRVVRWAVLCVYALGTVALSSILHRRFDLAASALALAAMTVGPIGSCALLGIGTALKLWPAVLLPVFLAPIIQDKHSKRLVHACAAFGVGVLVPVLPFVIEAGWGVLGFFSYHQSREIQVESVCALLPFALDSLELVPARVGWQYGADHVFSAVNVWLKPASSMMLVCLCALPFALAWRTRLSLQGLAVQVQLATAALLGFLLGAKVLSTQYVSWVLPLAAVAAWTASPGIERRWAIGMTVALPVLTALIYHHYYSVLCQGPRTVAYVVFVSRALCMVGLYYLMLRTATRGTVAHDFRS